MGWQKTSVAVYKHLPLYGTGNTQNAHCEENQQLCVLLSKLLEICLLCVFNLFNLFIYFGTNVKFKRLLIAQFFACR